MREDGVGLQQYAPEAAGGIRIIAAVGAVLGEGDRLGELDRPLVDRDPDAELAQQRADA